MFCAVNACDDDAEVLRFLDELNYVAVLPHQLFSVSTVVTCGGLIYWLYMDFGRTTTIAMAGVLGLFLAAQGLIYFHMVRASVACKARPVEGPEAAGALRRAASKANLAAMAPLEANALGTNSGVRPGGLLRRSALRGANEARTHDGRHVTFCAAADLACCNA